MFLASKSTERPAKEYFSVTEKNEGGGYSANPIELSQSQLFAPLRKWLASLHEYHHDQYLLCIYHSGHLPGDKAQRFMD